MTETYTYEQVAEFHEKYGHGMNTINESWWAEEVIGDFAKIVRLWNDCEQYRLGFLAGVHFHDPDGHGKQDSTQQEIFGSLRKFYELMNSKDFEYSDVGLIILEGMRERDEIL